MGNRYIDVTSAFSQTPCDTANSWFGYSAFDFILPFLEGGNQYASANFSLVASNAANVTAFSTRVASFLCPSDIDATRSSYPAGFFPAGQCFLRHEPRHSGNILLQLGDHVTSGSECPESPALQCGPGKWHVWHEGGREDFRRDRRYQQHQRCSGRMFALQE